ncbi:hypothetical protein SAMN04490247_3268 [Salimicrobium halophilum]|uniref:Uncharacterized protein n=1 Tax=Salimicrobium halophilum TaxID=86666 RepID=A0A1G8WR13_9BACI|nr:hypothetical protein SAMN04490247_3268 [Salimicrobium halophilum]
MRTLLPFPSLNFHDVTIQGLARMNGILMIEPVSGTEVDHPVFELLNGFL